MFVRQFEQNCYTYIFLVTRQPLQIILRDAADIIVLKIMEMCSRNGIAINSHICRNKTSKWTQIVTLCNSRKDRRIGEEANKREKWKSRAWNRIKNKRGEGNSRKERKIGEETNKRKKLGTRARNRIRGKEPKKWTQSASFYLLKQNVREGRSDASAFRG